jgi:Mn2+/Fe2+ NRAMP family transporter
VALGIGCFGAALELTVNAGYLLAQSFGWSWGLDKQRRNAARFVLAFSVVLSLGALIGLTGLDPLQLTLMCVALTVVVLPFIVLPFLVLMNDERYVGTHRSGAWGNALLAVLTVAYGLMALVVIPLQIAGGG